MAKSKPTELKIIPDSPDPIVERMCKGCPFRPDGEGLVAPDSEEGKRVYTMVSNGGTFYCHETVYRHQDSRIESTADGPQPKFGRHWQRCLGAVAFHRKQLLEKGVKVVSSEEYKAYIAKRFPQFQLSSEGNSRAKRRNHKCK